MEQTSDATSGTASEGRCHRRTSRRSRTLLAVGGVAAAASLAIAGVAGASAAGSTPGTPGAPANPPATATNHPPKGRDPLLAHLLRGAIHADLVVRAKTGATETFVFDRGVVTSVTSTAITITPADTQSATVAATITSKTRFPGLPESQLKSGDKVGVVVHGGDAVMVASRPARPGSSSPNSRAGGPSSPNSRAGRPSASNSRAGGPSSPSSPTAS